MFSTILAALLSVTILQAGPSVLWKASVNHTDKDKYQLVLSGTVAPDYYVHPMSDPYIGTSLTVDSSDGVFIAGGAWLLISPASLSQYLKYILGGIVARENIECDNESGQVLIRTDKEDIRLLNRLRLLEQFVPYRIGG